MKNRKWLVALGVPALTACPGPDPTTCRLFGGGGVISYEPVSRMRVDGGSYEAVDGPWLDPADCSELCPPTANRCQIIDAGLVECSKFCIGGRAPPGMKTLANVVDGSTGSWLARMAELEAAAVQAFIHLARELDAHGLPDFADAAVVAASHEVRHANAVARLAMEHGFIARRPDIVATPIRSLEALALDNAGEGCGRELFGAALNQHQASTATIPSVARVMGEIAEEENAHARFSLALAATLTPRLTVAQRRRARDAQAEVLETLSDAPLTDSVRTSLGLMDSDAANRLARRLLTDHRV